MHKIAVKKIEIYLTFISNNIVKFVEKQWIDKNLYVNFLKILIITCANLCCKLKKIKNNFREFKN